MCASASKPQIWAFKNSRQACYYNCYFCCSCCYTTNNHSYSHCSAQGKRSVSDSNKNRLWFLQTSDIFRDEKLACSKILLGVSRLAVLARSCHSSSSCCCETESSRSRSLCITSCILELARHCCEITTTWWQTASSSNLCQNIFPISMAGLLGLQTKEIYWLQTLLSSNRERYILWVTYSGQLEPSARNI